MNHQGNQERTLRRSTRRSRGAIASSEQVTEGNNEDTTEVQLVQQQIEDQDIYQDYKCAICLDVLSDPYIIPECCHRFCCGCIHESIKAGNKECPTCRVHIVSKRNLRRDELFGKMLNRLLKVEIEVKAMKLKEKTSTSVPLENDKTDGEEQEHPDFTMKPCTWCCKYNAKVMRNTVDQTAALRQHWTTCVEYQKQMKNVPKKNVEEKIKEKREKHTVYMREWRAKQATKKEEE